MTCIFPLAVKDIMDTLKNGSRFYPSFCSGDSKIDLSAIMGSVNLDIELASASPLPVSRGIQDSIGFKDKLMFIYTSGTTGLPKAAVIKQSR